MPVDPPQPPGWYPDPGGSGAHRWWDGRQWTEALGGAVPPGPAPATVTPPHTWAMVAHLSALGAAFLALAFLGPLIVYLVKRDEHPFIRDQAAEALNFQLSWLLYAIVCGLGLLVWIWVFLVGIVFLPILIALAISWLVLTVVAGLKANAGVAYRYPLTIRFVR